jgi:ABC-type transport system involved in cytochrome c biogenesis ATPase subunit
MFVWILFIFLIPGFTQKVSENKAFCSIKDYQKEIEKFKIVGDFERDCLEKAGKYNESKYEQFREFAENYWKNFYPKIQAMEETLLDEIEENINRFNNISLLTPSTIYYLNSIEVSTRGYESFKNFYSYLLDLKKKFVRFYIDRYYYNDPKIMVNFIKEDENLFHAKSRLPQNFTVGVLINLGYIIILFIVSFILFKRSLYKVRREEIEKLKDANIEVKAGELSVWLVKDDKFSNLLYNLLSGNLDKVKQKGFTGKVLVNGVDIAAEKSRQDFVYISRTENIPEDMRVRDFINFYARMQKIPAKEKRAILDSEDIKSTAGDTFSKLTYIRKFNVLLAILKLKKKQVYLINDIATGLPVTSAIKLKEYMAELAEQGSPVIYLTTTTDEDMTGMPHYFHEGSNWLYYIEGNKRTIARKKEIAKEK